MWTVEAVLWILNSQGKIPREVSYLDSLSVFPQLFPSLNGFLELTLPAVPFQLQQGLRPRLLGKDSVTSEGPCDVCHALLWHPC